MDVRDKRIFLVICCGLNFVVAAAVACFTWGRWLAEEQATRVETGPTPCDTLTVEGSEADGARTHQDDIPRAACR